jgi:transposase
MEKTAFLGIDVSKETVDTMIYHGRIHGKFVNGKPGFEKIKKWLSDQAIRKEDLLICFEHTGLYGLPLQMFCEDEGFDYTIVSGLQVKRSLGIQRGKNDKVDSYRLAEYAYIKRDTIKPTRLVSRLLIRLKYLLNYRSRLVRSRAGFKASAPEYKTYMKLSKEDVIINTHLQTIDHFTKCILKVDKEIKELLKKDEQIKHQYQMATSVKGIGMVTAGFMIVYTNCFTDFTKWRKFASYVGSAPFDHSSGTSFKGKTRISNYANKHIKSILTNAVLAAIRSDPEIKRYYQRRITEGKNRKVVINNIRNKLISRVFAAVKRGTPFVSIANYAA